MKKIFVMMSAILMLCFSVCAANGNEQTNVNWEKGIITAEGYGCAPDNVSSQGRRNVLARRAAVVDAYRNIAEQVYGVHIDSSTTVKDAAVASDIVNTNVSALIKGARIISEEQMNDGSYKVTMQISMYGETESLAKVVLPPTTNPTPFPAQLPTAAPSTTVQTVGGYTGLIVDCRGLGLQPMMSPVIRAASGDPVYGHKNLDSAKVIAYGMASYAYDFHTSPRAGANPMIVKAISLENHNGYPVISVEDANRVLAENQRTNFLEKCAVVFIR